MKTKYYVYALQSLKDKQLYIGMTNDVKRRLNEHNSGYSKSTKSRIPFKLIYEKECENREEARKKEKKLKTGSGREFLKQLIKDIPL